MTDFLVQVIKHHQSGLPEEDRLTDEQIAELLQTGKAVAKSGQEYDFDCWSAEEENEH